MAIFNSYLYVYQRVLPKSHGETEESIGSPAVSTPRSPVILLRSNASDEQQLGLGLGRFTGWGNGWLNSSTNDQFMIIIHL